MYIRFSTIVVLFLGLLVLPMRSEAESLYQAKEVDPSHISYPQIRDVDLSGYTPEAVEAKMDEARRRTPGTIQLRSVKELVEMRLLYSNDGLYKMGLLQGALPEVIYVEGGVVTLEQVNQVYPEILRLEDDGTYLARRPLVVGVQATLIVADCILKLSEEKGAFLVNGGDLFFSGSELIGWRETANTPAFYSGKRKQFRPYFISWGGSNTYLSNARVSHLGYDRTKSYGVSFSAYHVKPNEKMFSHKSFDFYQHPTGWIVNSTFTGMYFGFYCYEARDVAIVGNTYSDNIIYGIDPHDRSSGLIIARNKVYGTKEKHGIIISREVTDSFIIENESYDNKSSGIMLDRQCTGNLVARNTVYKNGGDGITFYESGNNIVYKNTVLTNKDHGIRLRNSQDVTLLENVIVNNKKFGVYLHSRHLTDIERDLVLDPYEQIVSGNIYDGTVSFNHSGSIYLKNVDRFTIYDVMIDNKKYGMLNLGGDAIHFYGQVARALSGGETALSLTRLHE